MKVERPWGTEELLEKNNWYAVKRIFLKAGEKSSLQYHNDKIETIYVLSGRLDFEHNGIMRTMQENDWVQVNPGEIHRMNGVEDTWILEAQSPHLLDVVRLEDRYGRTGTQDKAYE